MSSPHFPRVNLASILAGALALISVFLPWWGLTGSGFGFSASVLWSLWGQPYMGDTSSSPAVAQAAHTMGLLNLIVLGLVFITAALLFLGSFAENKAYIATGFLSAITTLLVYARAVVTPSTGPVRDHRAFLDQSVRLSHLVQS